MKLVHVLSDPLAESLSVNRRVASRFVEAMRAILPGLSVETVDLSQDPPPYYDTQLFRFLWMPVSDPDYQASAEERAAAEYMLRQVECLRDADFLLLSAPVWNYYLPAVLKAWIDQVLSPGQMFEFGAEGRIPLHRIRAMVSVISAGGRVSDQHVSRSLFHLLHESFRYAGVDNFHDILIEAQEPALYPDHARRETAALELAEKIAETIPGDSEQASS